MIESALLSSCGACSYFFVKTIVEVGRAVVSLSVIAMPSQLAACRTLSEPTNSIAAPDWVHLPLPESTYTERFPSTVSFMLMVER